MPKKAAHNHAKRRAIQRYGENLNRVDLIKIMDLIHAHKAEKLCQVSNSRRVYKVRYEDKNYILVYSNGNKCIVTFLPPEAELEYRTEDTGREVA